jgi:pimeloyl-ACP methyl ester carboxylesterase
VLRIKFSAGRQFCAPKSASSPSAKTLWGEKDELFPVKEGKKFANSVDAKLKVIHNAGHAPQIDRPSKFTKAICDFLRN